MRALAFALALLVAPALADVTQSTAGPLTYTLKRGSATVAAGAAGTIADCWAAASADAAARMVSASYSCTLAPQSATETYAAAAPPPPPPPASGAYSTTFPLVENPMSEGGRWIDGKVKTGYWNNVQTTGAGAFGAIVMDPNNRYSDDIATLNPVVLPIGPNQFAEAVVSRAPGYSAKHEIELLLRFNIVAWGNAYGYEVGFGQDYWFVARWNGGGGQYTAFYDPGPGSMPTLVDGEVLRAEITGTTITVRRNGVVIGTVSVASGAVWSSGQPGVGFWPVDGADPLKYGWKSYTAGSLP